MQKAEIFNMAKEIRNQKKKMRTECRMHEFKL